ncbi:MAG TPA: discoidin domain-containing protein [Polyangiaceae bacterium]|nr:discoidin domain-containing protein [Polyangiaceae bacterium]
MFPRSAHSLLRLASLLIAGVPACSVYGASLLAGEDASSSAAATSTGGELGAGSANGGADGGTIATGAHGGAESAGSSSGGSNAGGDPNAAGGVAGATNGGAAGKGGASAGATGAGGTAGPGGAGGSAGAPAVHPCNRANWQVSASESSLSTKTPTLNCPPPQAIDGNGNTRWSSGAAQVGGEWFLIDLGAVATHLTQVVLDTTAHPTDNPSGYKLELSSDGSTYSSVATGSGSSLTTIQFTDRPARYLRVTQTGTSLSWWSISELSVSCQSN